MSEKLVILGVKHLARNLPKVESFLSKYPLRDKKVLTEFEETYKKSSHEFYGPLQQFLLSQGAVVLHEEGEHELSAQAMHEYEKVFKERHELERQLLYIQDEEAKRKEDTPGRLRILDAIANLYSTHLDDFLLLNSKYRNPNILNLISDRRPDFVVIGNGHIREVYPDIVRNITDREMVYVVFD